MTDKDRLAEVRADIDLIDQQLIALINQRARLAQTVGRLKQQAGQENHFYRPEREAAILREVVQHNPGPIDQQGLVRIFRELMSACLAMEKRLQVAYLGPEGTFTQAAVGKHFGGSVTACALPGIDLVFREVATGSCEYGVVPIENSIEGVVNHTLDMFINSAAIICGEVHLRIHQSLLSSADDVKHIKTVYSHALSFAQCRHWLDTHLPGVSCVNVYSNAEAAKLAQADRTAAAIAGHVAADTYQLHTLADNIADEPDNTTRFLVIGNQAVPASGDDKTSVLFATPSEPGALVNVLHCFSDNKVNMNRIESRPSRQVMWEYVFFVDLEGHRDDANVSTSLEQLKANASMVKILGSYPVAS